MLCTDINIIKMLGAMIKKNYFASLLVLAAPKTVAKTNNLQSSSEGRINALNPKRKI
jgi:hypothetical protein